MFTWNPFDSVYTNFDVREPFIVNGNITTTTAPLRRQQPVPHNLQELQELKTGGLYDELVDCFNAAIYGGWGVSAIITELVRRISKYCQLKFVNGESCPPPVLTLKQEEFQLARDVIDFYNFATVQRDSLLVLVEFRRRMDRCRKDLEVKVVETFPKDPYTVLGDKSPGDNSRDQDFTIEDTTDET